MQDGHVTTASVLICDLVSSTPQRTSLGDDAADRLTVQLDRMLRQCVTRHRGTVVKPTGDGLMATFAAAGDALNAATAIHQATDRHSRNAPAGEHLVMRIGISAGDVHFVAHDCHGTPVVEAARLEAAAAPGSILVSALVRLLVGSRGSHEFEAAGALQLKGLPEPLEAYRVHWSPTPDAPDAATDPPQTRAATRVPLPDRLAFRPPIGMVGYGPERQAIAEAFKRVAAGDGREIVLVLGEAGLGKTTVAAEAARDAFADGACVLLGHCEEGIGTPYQLFVEALTHYVEHAPLDELIAHVDAHGSELTRLVPALARRIPDLGPSRAADPDTDRYVMFAAAAGLLTAAAARAPVMLVLDDLQWADRASLLLLTHIVGGHAGARILVVGTIRDSELEQAEALRETLGALQRFTGLSRAELPGLDPAQVLEYMEAYAGHRLDTAGRRLADVVHRETDGNPFFVGQVLRHLAETGAIYQDASGHWVPEAVAGIDLPDSVREVIGGRVVRLGARAERLLGLAAVIGSDFQFELLAAVSATPSVDELMDMLEEAQAAALVREDGSRPGQFRFVHGLIQQTLYENLGPTRRQYAHRRVAETLEAMEGERSDVRAAELARHWSNAGPEHRDKAITYSRQAGDAALAALAPSEALDHYTNALRLLEQQSGSDSALGLDLAIGLGTAQRQVGRPEYRDTLLAAARVAIDHDDTARVVAAALALHRGLFSNFGAIDAERIAILDEALARVEAGDPNRALILSTYCLEIVVGSSLEQKQAIASEALAIAEATADDAIIVRVLNNVAYALMSPPMLDESLVRTAHGLERAARLGDPVLHFFAANWRRQACAQAGYLEEMSRCTELMSRLEQQLNQPMFTWVHTFGLAWLAIIRGDTADAEQLATEALQVGTDSGQPDAAFIFGAQMVIVHHQRGILDALRPLLEDMAGSAPSIAGVLRGAMIAADIEAGRVDAARAGMASFAATGCNLEMNPVWISGMAFYAEAAIELDDPVFALPLFDRLLPWASQWSDNGATAASPVGHFLGGLSMVLGHYGEADRYLSRSATVCREGGAKFFLAQTELLWARLLLRRGHDGDSAKARALLQRAADGARAHGYALVERRATDALALTLSSGGA